MTTPELRPLQVDPGPEYDALMDALDAWVKAARPTWAEGEATLAGLLGVVHYGDASCDCGTATEAFNWPHRFERSDGSWRAAYRCRACGRTYSCWYAGLDLWLTL